MNGPRTWTADWAGILREVEHPCNRYTIYVIGGVVRDPRQPFEVARTEAKESLFWFLLPRVCGCYIKDGAIRIIKALKLSLARVAYGEN